MGRTQILRLLGRNVGVSRRGLATAASTLPIPERPPCDHTPSPYTGPSYEEVLRLRSERLTPALLTFFKQPLLVHEGHKHWLFDHKGDRYMDLISSMVTLSIGHCHPKVNAALHAQVDKLWHTTSIYMHPGIQEYAKKLTDKMPGNLKVVYFVNSGSEANDLAMMMARMHTGNYDLVGFRSGYHGGTSNVMALTAMSSWRFGLPMSFGVHQTMNPDPYRGVWGGANCRDSPVQSDRECACAPGECQACGKYLEQLEETLSTVIPKKGLAGFIAESIQGSGGVTQYPKGFLKGAYEMVREKGGVCIADEVQTAFGRLGSHYWGFETHDVQPDIVTMAKGIGNGFPLAAVVTTPEIAKTMGAQNALHFNTFGGNPMACAVGMSVLDVLEEEKCQEVAAVQGTYLLQEMGKLRDEFAIVGDVRGKGLMCGMDLVTDKVSRKPLPATEFNSIWEECKDMGILLGRGGLAGNVFRIKPSMCIGKQDVDFIVAVLRKAIADHLVRHPR